jgi:hypothetical protein
MRTRGIDSRGMGNGAICIVRRVAVAAGFMAALALLLALPYASPKAMQAAPQKAPAQFKTSGAFSGGAKLAGSVLDGIRFGKHPDFMRVVFDFSVESGGKRTGAPSHPSYKIEYKKFPYRFKITLEGVKYAEDAVVQSVDAIPFSIVTSSDNTIQIMELFVPGPAMFKVIEVDDPAKLSLDIKFLPNEPVPTVWAVQLQDVKDVQSAFKLLNAGGFPEGFEPDILVIGNSVYVEGIYLTLDAAAQAVAKLDDMGIPAIVAERKGSELPRR